MPAYPTDYRQPWIDEDGFVRFRTGDERRSKEIVEHTFHVASSLTDGEVQAWLVDARAMTSAEPQAWLAIAERLISLSSALAILTSDETPETLSTWQGLFDSLLVPCQLFGDEESAVTWLRSLES